MKNLTTLLIFFISLAAQGQIWIDTGATWHYEKTGHYNGLDKIEFVGDTLIQDQTCQKLQISSYTFAPSEWGGGIMSTSISEKYTYSSGDTVFYLVNDQFHILYNFGAQVGDTWELGFDTNALLCGPSFVEVTSSGSTEINGEMVEWIAVTTLPNSSVGLEGKIYKRFGATSDYLFPTYINCDPNLVVEFYMYQFSCFEDDSFSLYNVTDNDCDYYLSLGIDETKNTEKIVSVFPNPASDNISIRILKPNYKLTNIVIRDTQGRLLDNVFQSEVDISDLPKGLYLLHIEFENYRSVVQRFIKE